MPTKASSQLFATLLWRPAVYNRSQLLGGSWMAATRQFYELAGYFPNRKRLKNERHIFQRFLLVLRENSSFHFLCCITPLWYFKSTTGTLLVTSYPILFLCLLSSTAKASSNLSCFPNSSAPGFPHLKRLARGILST